MALTYGQMGHNGPVTGAGGDFGHGHGQLQALEHAYLAQNVNHHHHSTMRPMNEYNSLGASLVALDAMYGRQSTAADILASDRLSACMELYSNPGRASSYGSMNMDIAGMDPAHASFQGFPTMDSRRSFSLQNGHVGAITPSLLNSSLPDNVNTHARTNGRLSFIDPNALAALDGMSNYSGTTDMLHDQLMHFQSLYNNPNPNRTFTNLGISDFIRQQENANANANAATNNNNPVPASNSISNPTSSSNANTVPGTTPASGSNPSRSSRSSRSRSSRSGSRVRNYGFARTLQSPPANAGLETDLPAVPTPSDLHAANTASAAGSSGNYNPLMQIIIELQRRNQNHDSHNAGSAASSQGMRTYPQLPSDTNLVYQSPPLTLQADALNSAQAPNTTTNRTNNKNNDNNKNPSSAANPQSRTTTTTATTAQRNTQSNRDESESMYSADTDQTKTLSNQTSSRSSNIPTGVTTTNISALAGSSTTATHGSDLNSSIASASASGAAEAPSDSTSSASNSIKSALARLNFEHEAKVLRLMIQNQGLLASDPNVLSDLATLPPFNTMNLSSSSRNDPTRAGRGHHNNPLMTFMEPHLNSMNQRARAPPGQPATYAGNLTNPTSLASIPNHGIARSFPPPTSSTSQHNVDDRGVAATTATTLSEFSHNVSDMDRSSYDGNNGMDRDASSTRAPEAKRFKVFHEVKWTDNLKDLKRFKDQFGHCLVPHTFPANPHLARWVKRQRRQYKLLQEGSDSTMTDERIQLLNDIGFVWDSHEVVWMERFHELLGYKNVYGHCRVPSSCKRHPQLATWVKSQRRQYKLYHEGKQSSMTNIRITHLNSIGFAWEVRKPNSTTLDDGGSDKDE
jgi:hypothetical protein